MDAQQKLYGLITIAEDQQKAVNAAIDGLTKARAALTEARADLAGVANDVQKTTYRAVGQSLVGVSEVVVSALDQASKPLIGKLSEVTTTAGEVENRLSKAVAGFGWRWAGLVAGSAAGGIATVVLTAWLMVWWQRSQVEQLAEQRAELQTEVAQLKVNAEDWAKRGGRIKLDKCGDAGRLCVRIDKTQGYGKDGDYFVLLGY